MQRGAIYIRVSTAGQVDGTSLESQQRECMALATRNGCEVPADLIFQDVMSGMRDDRPGFNRMMEAARAGRFTHVFVWSADRFGRSLRLAVNAIDDLKKAGAVVYSVKEGSFSDPFLVAVFSGMAEREHARIKERTFPAKMAKRAAGFWVVGRPPYGYRLRPDKTLEVCLPEAEVVRRIFRDAATGLGRVAIARRLNSDRIMPPEARVPAEGKVRRTRIMQADDPQQAYGGAITLPEWQSRTIASILNNTMAYGEKSGQRFIIHPAPIIDKSDYLAAHDAMNARARKGKAPDPRWLLTGLIKCSCGASYRHHEGNGKTHRYVCSARKSGKSCRNPSVRVETAEAHVIRAVSGYLSDISIDSLSNFILHTLRARTADVERQLAAKVKERDEIEAAWRAAQDEFSAALKAGLSAAHVPAIVERLKEHESHFRRLGKEISTVRDEINRLEEGASVSASEVAQVARQLQHTFMLRVAHYNAQGQVEEIEDTTDLRRVLHAMVKACTVLPDRTILVELHDFEQEGGRLHRLLLELVHEEFRSVRIFRASTAA